MSEPTLGAIRAPHPNDAFVVCVGDDERIRAGAIGMRTELRFGER